MRLRPRLASRHHNDEGAALLMALIFLMVVGLLISVALTKSGSTAQAGTNLREQTQLQYTSDAGIDRALQLLRSDLSRSGGPHYCVTTGSSATDFGDSGGLSVGNGGHTTHYSCQTVAGSADGIGSSKKTVNYAVVTTGGGHAFTTSNAVGGSNPLPIDGSIYLSGDETNADVSKQVTVTKGQVVEYQDPANRSLGECQDSLDALTNLTVLTQGNVKACTLQPVKDVIPQPVLPSVPGNAPQPVLYPFVPPDDGKGGGKKPSPTCKVFLPGSYSSAPDLLSGADTANYFLGGLYYFKNVGQWSIGNNTTVFGGTPAATDTPQLSGSGCEALADTSKLQQLFSDTSLTPPTNLWTSGAEFVFGGNSTLSVSGALAMFTPSDATAAGVSLLAVRSSAWSPSGVSSDTALGYTPWGAGTTPVLANGSATIGTTIYGRILAPDAPIQLFASQPSQALARAGLVGKTVDLSASAGVVGGSFAFTVADDSEQSTPPAPRRTIRIIAKTPSNGGTPFSEVAVATIDNFGSQPVHVFSWRACTTSTESKCQQPSP